MDWNGERISTMDTEQLSMTKKTLVGVQFLFVAFGATVLVASCDTVFDVWVGRVLDQVVQDSQSLY